MKTCIEKKNYLVLRTAACSFDFSDYMVTEEEALSRANHYARQGITATVVKIIAHVFPSSKVEKVN